MYAIIADSGKQFKVVEGQTIDIDYREAHKGDPITFEKVLCVSGDDGAQIGRPTLDGAKVTGEVIGVKQGPKLVIQKLRRRKNSRRKTGHRQLYTSVKIDKIATA